jgi:hypothetical protein
MPERDPLSTSLILGVLGLLALAIIAKIISK